jgi:formate dehydrogenase major subunit
VTRKRDFEARQNVCPFCGVGCTITYAPESGKSTGVAGPVNEKGELCPKGAAAFDIVDHEDRLTRPLVREGGHLVTAPWAEALERVESGVKRVVDEHGPDSVVFFASSNCTDEENYVFQKVARLLGRNNVDNCARLCHSSTVAAMDGPLRRGRDGQHARGPPGSRPVPRDRREPGRTAPRRVPVVPTAGRP